MDVSKCAAEIIASKTWDPFREYPLFQKQAPVAQVDQNTNCNQ